MCSLLIYALRTCWTQEPSEHCFSKLLLLLLLKNCFISWVGSKRTIKHPARENKQGMEKGTGESELGIWGFSPHLSIHSFISAVTFTWWFVGPQWVVLAEDFLSRQAQKGHFCPVICSLGSVRGCSRCWETAPACRPAPGLSWLRFCSVCSSPTWCSEPKVYWKGGWQVLGHCPDFVKDLVIQ